MYSRGTRGVNIPARGDKTRFASKCLARAAFVPICLLPRWIIYRSALAQTVASVTPLYSRLRLVAVPLTTSRDGYPRRAFHGIHWTENFHVSRFRSRLPRDLIPVNYHQLLSPAALRLHRRQRSSIHEGRTEFLIEINVLLWFLDKDKVRLLVVILKYISFYFSFRKIEIRKWSS